MFLKKPCSKLSIIINITKPFKHMLGYQILGMTLLVSDLIKQILNQAFIIKNKDISQAFLSEFLGWELLGYCPCVCCCYLIVSAVEPSCLKYLLIHIIFREFQTKSFIQFTGINSSHSVLHVLRGCLSFLKDNLSLWGCMSLTLNQSMSFYAIQARDWSLNCQVSLFT